MNWELTSDSVHWTAERWLVPKGRCQPEPPMSIPRTVAEVIREHVCLEVEGIDRMYLNVYVPALQRKGGVASFSDSIEVISWRPAF